MFKKLRKSAFFSSFFLPMDPDPDPHKSLNPDPIRIRIHNPALDPAKLVKLLFAVVQKCIPLSNIKDQKKQGKVKRFFKISKSLVRNP
jgi:hypothetical protein